MYFWILHLAAFYLAFSNYPYQQLTKEKVKKHKSAVGLLVPLLILSSLVFILFLFLFDLSDFRSKVFLWSVQFLKLLAITNLVEDQLKLYFTQCVLAHLKLFRTRPLERRRKNRVNTNPELEKQLLENVLN